MDPGFTSFDKLQEVGVSPYLCFIPILRVFRCFDWFEAVRSRLIGPKTWDRSVRIFGSRLGNPGTVTDCYGFFCDNLLNKLCFGVYKCDAPKPGGPLTTRQPAEYKWTSGYPMPL